MALHATSYFAGVGTVVATMALGFGGGVLLTDAFVGKSERAQTLMERRAASPESSVPASAPVAPPTEQQAAAPAPATPAALSRAVDQATAPQQSATLQGAAPPPPSRPTTMSSPQQQAAAPMQTSTSPSATPAQDRFEQSMGHAQDSDLVNRAAEARKVTERRRHERRKWAERRKRDMQKIDDLTAMSEKVREADRSREREPVFRSFASEAPPINRSPVNRLFGDTDD